MDSEMQAGERKSVQTPRVVTALWSGFVVVLGPVLNFVRDASQQYPFYDHGAPVAVVIAVVLTIACAFVFAPPITRLVTRAGSRSTWGNLTAAAVFAVCVAAAHLAGYLLGDSEWLGSAGWLVAYPVGSLAAWWALARVGGGHGEASQTFDRSASRTTV